MRTTLIFSTLAVLSACGPTGNTPWDMNHDGLITACEGLNSQTCDATVGCEPAPQDCAPGVVAGGGHCTGAETCRPTPQTPPLFACSSLSIAACAVTPRCEVVNAFSSGGADFAQRPDTTTQRCVDRAPASCESLSTDVCLAHPGCALEGSADVCDIAFDPSGNRPSCAPIAPQRCVTLPPPDVCAARDANTCTIDDRCVLEQGAVCDAICAPDGTCPPCAVPSVRCVPAPAPDLCGARDLNTCSIDGRCMVQAWACPAICEPDGNGGCVPCDALPAACVPVTEPDFCGARDLNVCSIDGRCMVEAWACPAICEPDGNGGCVPCAAPPAACVPVPVVSRCEYLDRSSCEAAGCGVIELDIVCTLECQDDGHGGCIPCRDFVCTDSSGGGLTPPRP